MDTYLTKIQTDFLPQRPTYTATATAPQGALVSGPREIGLYVGG